MEQNILTLQGDGYGLTVKQEAIALKAALIERSSQLIKIDSKEALTVARQIVKQLAAFRNQLEKSRKAVKEPVLDLGKKIDAAAEKFGAEVIAEEERITQIGQSYAAEQERIKREAAERARKEAEEVAKLAREEAERARRDAEAAEAKGRVEKAALEAIAKKATEAEQAMILKMEEELAKRLAAEREAESLRQAEAARAAKAVQIADASFATPAVAGMKSDVDFEVVDIDRLYAARPDLVELTPRRAKILAALKESSFEIPGIRRTEKISFKR